MRSERETENHGVTEKHNIGTAVSVQLECPEISCGTKVLKYQVLHYSSQYIVVLFDDTYYRTWYTNITIVLYCIVL